MASLTMKLAMKQLPLLAVAVWSVAGCDWRNLDDAVKGAPVQSIGAPGGFISDGLGRLIVPMTPDPASGMSARFMFFGAGTAFSGGLVDIDAKGDAHVVNVPAGVVTALMGKTVQSAALALPDTVILGTGDFGNPKRGAAWFLKVLPGPSPSFQLSSHAGLSVTDGADLNWGRGVAVGDVDGNPAFKDHVFLSLSKVTLLIDGTVGTDAMGVERNRIMPVPGTTCGTSLDGTLDSLPRYVLPRAVAVADLVPGSGGEILVGVPTGNVAAPGVVRVLQSSDTDAMEQISTQLTGIQKVLRCAATLTAPVGTPAESAAHFGVSVAVGDFDGDLVKDDVAVGAPPQRVFVFLGALAGVGQSGPGTMPAMVSTGTPIAVPLDALGTEFGLRVAAMNYDGLPGDEVVVSAPLAPAGSTAEAGKVWVFKGDGSRLPVGGEIADTQPQTGAWLGYDVAGVPFTAPACVKTGAAPVTKNVLLAGTGDEIFVYFNAPGSAGDPRCK